MFPFSSSIHNFIALPVRTFQELTRETNNFDSKREAKTLNLKTRNQRMNCVWVICNALCIAIVIVFAIVSNIHPISILHVLNNNQRLFSFVVSEKFVWVLASKIIWMELYSSLYKCRDSWFLILYEFSIFNLILLSVVCVYVCVCRSFLPRLNIHSNTIFF